MVFLSINHTVRTLTTLHFINSISLSVAGKSSGSNNPVVVNSITKLQTLMVDGKVLVQGGKVRKSGSNVSHKI